MTALTPRHLQVLQLMADGHTCHTIADELNINYTAVKEQRKGLFKRLGVHSPEHAVAVAYQRGILSPDPDVVEAADLLRRAHRHGYRLALTLVRMEPS
jgi:DNA-binding NarL/FixJ family response regulator